MNLSPVNNAATTNVNYPSTAMMNLYPSTSTMMMNFPPSATAMMMNLPPSNNATTTNGNYLSEATQLSGDHTAVQKLDAKADMSNPLTSQQFNSKVAAARL